MDRWFKADMTDQADWASGPHEELDMNVNYSRAQFFGAY